MKHRAWFTFFLLGICLLAKAAPAADAFRAASNEYAAGNFEQSASTFRALADKEPSSGILHNLGNAEWRAGHQGEAVLAWEQAHWMDPYSPGPRNNLRYARQSAQLPTPQLTWYELCSTWLPANAWAWIASLSFWLAVSMVILPGVLRWRKADWHQALAASGFAVLLLTMPALLGVQTRSNIGVVRAKDTPLRLTPTREAQVMSKLVAGEVARLERGRGDYVYVRAGSDVAGWIKRDQFGLISGGK